MPLVEKKGEDGLFLFSFRINKILQKIKEQEFCLVLFMHVPVPSQKPVKEWLSFMCYIFVFCSFFYINKAVIFSFELFYIVISGLFIADYAVWALLIVEGRAVT